MHQLRLISSVPDLQTRVNIHPLRNDAGAPLFITSRTYGGTEIYVHLSGSDIERKMLENAGLIDIDEKGPTTLEPMMCPRCRSLNAFDAIYCSKCSMALNEQAAMKVEKSAEEAKESEEYRVLVERLRKDLGMVSE